MGKTLMRLRWLNASWVLIGFVALCATVSVAETRDTVLVLRPESDQFTRVKSGFQDGLEGELALEDKIVTLKTTVDDLTVWIEETQPRFVLLMDTLAVRLYQRFQALSSQKNFPASIIVATLFAEQAVTAIANSAGIGYEIPAITSLVELRVLLRSPIKRVGVIYSESKQAYFEEQRQFSAREGIELVGRMVDNEPSKRSLRRAIIRLIRDDVQAFWVINDGSLMSRSLIEGAWQPALERYKGAVAVGIPSLIQPSFQFGDYAVFPDHYGLGEQASYLLFDLLDGWRDDENIFQQPVSIRKAVNVNRLREKGLRPYRTVLAEFDQVLR